MRPFIGLLVWSWLGYMNPHRLCYGFAYSFPWVQLVAIVTLASLVFSKERKKIPLCTVSVLLFVFLAWTGVTTLFAVAPDAAVEEFQKFLKILIMVFLTFMLVNNRERMHWLVWMIVVSLGFYGFKGGCSPRSMAAINHVLGPPGTFIADNNALALALCMILPLMRYLQLHPARKFVRTGLGFGMFFTGIAILGTYSRGGLIALAIVAGALFLKSRRQACGSAGYIWWSGLSPITSCRLNGRHAWVRCITPHRRIRARHGYSHGSSRQTWPSIIHWWVVVLTIMKTSRSGIGLHQRVPATRHTQHLFPRDERAGLRGAGSFPRVAGCKLEKLQPCQEEDAGFTGPKVGIRSRLDAAGGADRIHGGRRLPAHDLF